MSSPLLSALAVLAAVVALLVASLRALAAAGRRMRQPATVDIDRAADDTPQNTPAIVEPPAEIDEFTTDLELWLRLHTALNGIEETLRIGLDNALHRFMDQLGVDDAALVDAPGFPGVRELIGAP